jgi:hypothetical protein
MRTGIAIRVRTTLTVEHVAAPHGNGATSHGEGGPRND